MVRVAVCDDSEIQLHDATAALERFAESHGLDFEISGFKSTEELFELGCLDTLDIVFMDIEFEGRPQGIDAVRKINAVAPNCQVVYFTNYLQYSVDVYRTDHVWFILKNQFEERLPEVFEKLARIGDFRRQFIVVPTKDNGITKLPCRDIFYLERSNRLTRVVARDGSYETHDKLAAVAEKLPETTFAFCHSSFVVNMPYIVELHDTEVVLESGDTLPISRRYAKAFRQRYFEWADQWTV